MSTEINQFEWGKIVTLLDSLSREVVKLETKIDIFLKDAVTRREFEALQSQYEETATKKDIKNIEDRVSKLEASNEKLNAISNRNEWITKLIWVALGAVCAAAFGVWIK